MILTLSYSAGFENLEVRQAPDAPTADRYINALPEDRTAFIFDTDTPDWLGAQLYDRYTCGQLPALFNAVRDPSVPPVNKFEDKPTALRRLAAQLVARAKAARPLAPKPQPKQKDSTTMSEEHESKQRGPHPKLFDYDGKLRVLQANPYRAGTTRHATFAIYQDGMTAREALAAGAKPYDLNRAIRSGHLSIE